MAYVAPTTRSDGYVVTAAVWNSDAVANPIAINAGAVAIASQSTGDVITAASATQLGRVAPSTGGQVLTSNGAGVAPSFQPAGSSALSQGRLSLTTDVPVTTSDVTAATTLYWVPYGGNQIALYSGTAWVVFNQAQLSIAVPATTSQMYDVFVDYNAGTPALTVTAWTNDTTRATALTTQDGVLVLTGTLGKRYVGSFRTTTVSGQTEDSLANRLVWNYYHRSPRPMRAMDSTNSWVYSTATWRQANAAATNQLSVVVGMAETPVQAQVSGSAYNDTGGNTTYAHVGIGYDSTSAPTTGNVFSVQVMGVIGEIASPTATLVHFPAVGYHYYAWLENSAGIGVTTWAGDSNAPATFQSGISGWMNG